MNFQKYLFSVDHIVFSETVNLMFWVLETKYLVGNCEHTKLNYILQESHD